MTISRRRFLGQAMPLGLLPLGVACVAEVEEPGSGVMGLEPGDVFRHGVASGDPLADAVILWTRVTPPDDAAEAQGAAELEVEWRIARDPELVDVVARGRAVASAEADHCVKVDVTGLLPDSVYYYDFG